MLIRGHETLLGLPLGADELRSLEEVLERVKAQLGVVIAELLEFKLHVAVQFMHEVGVWSHAGRGLRDHRVARGLVAFHRRVVPFVERHVPHAQAVHCDEVGLATDAIFGIVAPHKQRQRQAVAFDHGNRDAAVPPRRIMVVWRDLLGHLMDFIEDDVFELGQAQRWLARREDTVLRHEAGVFPLVLAHLVVEHGAADHRLAVLRLEDA